MRSLTLSLLLFFAGVSIGCGSSPVVGAVADAGLPVDGGPPDAGVATCELDTACGAGRVCENGLCQDACSPQNPCPGGFTMTCAAGHCRQRCLGDTTCPSGQICEQFVCTPAQCTADRPCNGTNIRCNAGRCERFTPCTADTSCPADFVCREGICEELPRCLGDGNCTAGQICEEGHCRTAAACTLETDCQASQDCVAGLCVPHVCRGDADCTEEGQICSGGECVGAGNPAQIFKVVILSPGGITRPGETRQLTALALDQRDRAVEGVAFEWSTSEAAFVSVDLSTGLIRGGDQAGTAEIRAKAQGTPVVSDPVVFTNLLDPVEPTLRITLIDRQSGTLVQGAKVLLSGQAHDVNGTLSVPAPEGAVDFTVFHAAYDYVTVISTNAIDIVLPLTTRTALDPAAGLTGEIDLRRVSTDGPVRIGLAGLSTARTLTDFDFQRLLGDVFVSQVSIPGGGAPVAVPLPGGMTLAAEIIAGVSVNVKGSYYVLGDPGLRTGWSLGGRADVAEISAILGAGGGGGGLTVGGVLRQLFPLFERFDHGAVPAIAIQAIPRVTDSGDIDGDGDSAEKVPDWNGFRRVTQTPRQRQTLRTEVVLADLPQVGGTPVQGAILTAGVLVPGTGYVPLGLGAAFDDDSDGKIPPVVLRSAPVHSGLGVGRYALLALAASFGQGAALPQSFSARTSSFDLLPTRVEMGAFLPFPQSASYEAVPRRLRVAPVAGATVLRAVLQSTAGAWEIYSPAGSEELSVVLPTPPAGLSDDLAAGMDARIEAIALEGGTRLDDLLGGASFGLREINGAMEAFSRGAIERR